MPSAIHNLPVQYQNNRTLSSSHYAEAVDSASLCAQQQLGLAPAPVDRGLELPVGIRAMSDGNSSGVYLYVNKEATDGLSSGPLAWISAAVSGFVLPLMSFVIGHQSARLGDAKHQLKELDQLARQMYFDHRIQNDPDKRFSLSKIFNAWRNLMIAAVRHKERMLVAKTLLVAGAVVGFAVAAMTANVAMGLVSGAFSFVPGSCALWGALGSKLGHKRQNDRDAQTILHEANRLGRV